MSLIKKLHNLIQERGTLAHSELDQFCRENGYRLSNAERRLRTSESPLVESVKENGCIKAYKWIGKPLSYKEYYVDGKLVCKTPIYEH